MEFNLKTDLSVYVSMTLGDTKLLDNVTQDNINHTTDSSTLDKSQNILNLGDLSENASTESTVDILMFLDAHRTVCFLENLYILIS